MPRRSVRLGLNAPLEDRLTPSPAGDLDPVFGASGVANVQFIPPPAFSFTNPAANGTAIQADGRVILAGSVASVSSSGGQDFGIARLLPNGQLDPSFGTGLGTERLPFDLGGSNDDVANAVAIQPDGKIIVAGYAATANTGKDFAIARLNSDGSLDTTFAAGKGFATIPFSSGGSAFADDVANAVVLQKDGKIVLGGSSRFDFAVARLNTDGSLDTTFAGKGQTTIVYSTGGFNTDEITSMVIQPDGKIVAAGYTDGNNFQYDFAVTRLNTNGTVDGTFGSKGRSTVAFDMGGSNSDKAAGVALQSNGQILVVGTAEVSFGGFGSNRSDMAITRLNTDGTPDLNFGTGGNLTIGFNLGGSNTDEARAVLVQPDDKIVVAGSAERSSGFSSNGSFAVMRLNADGTFDTAFGNGGKTVVPVGSSFFFFGNSLPGANAVALQSDGNIVAAGGGSTFTAMRMLGAAPPPIPEPPVPPEPPSKQPVLPTPLSQLPVLPDPVLAGGAANGAGAVLFNQDGTFGPGSVLNFYPGQTVSVRTAVADVNGDLVPDYIGGTGVGVTSHVTVIDGKSGNTIISFQPFEDGFTGGVFVAAGDVNGDGLADLIVTPDQGGGPVVAVYNSASLLAGTKPDRSQFNRFLGIDDPNFRGGARTALGDINADGTPDLVVSAGFGGGPRIAIFNGKDVAAGSASPGRLTPDFFAFESSLRNGTFVSVGDTNGDGFADVAFGGGPGGAPRVRIINGSALTGSAAFSNLDQIVGTAQIGDFFAGDANQRGGVRVLLRDANGDGRADLTVGSGEGEPGRVTMYSATSLSLPTPVVARTQTVFGSDPLVDGVYVG